MVGIKFRRPMLSSPDITKFPENSGIKEELLLTTDCCQKKEKKRMMNSVENAEPESDDPDSQMIKIKKSQKDRDLPKTHLVKRKARWSLSKTLMKKKNLDLKVEKPMTSDFISDMDVNSIEVSGIDCDICKRRFPYPECTWCPNNDKICLNCIREVIRHTMDNRKLHLSCPKESCMVSINLDLLSKKVDPVTVEILGRKLQKWLERAHMEEFERLFGKVSVTLNQFWIKKRSISSAAIADCYCQQLWSSNISHNECRLLNYSGQKCFKESQDLPANWDKKEAVLSENNETIIGVEAQSSVSLKSNEGETVIRLFCETLKGTQVTAISRIQNIKLWEKYVLKRKHMIDEISLSKIKERVLFHGTEASNIPLICDEGFDMRVKTANGAVYGKGIYFSTTSHYSKRYAGSSNQMFLARVLCGYSTRGSQEMTRPPKHQGTGRMYDSCVNDIAKPTIYSLFDNAQCYPAYIISYK
ncbi:Protein mono-ADP-ribosyltransferase parp12 [Bulinus truncatus]|nr:Protein mono-ADP-ribosyltransferase parp12 [Bulinus truncatus]